MYLCDFPEQINGNLTAYEEVAAILCTSVDKLRANMTIPCTLALSKLLCKEERGKCAVTILSFLQVLCFSDENVMLPFVLKVSQNVGRL